MATPPEGSPCTVSAEAYRSSMRAARRLVPADLHLHLGQRRFPAHQFVLRALSPRIDHLCGQAGPGARVALDCGPLGVAPDALDAFLDMAYGGSAPPRHLPGVRQLAEYYQVGLVLDCLPGSKTRGRRGRAAPSPAAKAIKREPVEAAAVEVKLEPEEEEEEARFKRPTPRGRRKRDVVRALKSSAPAHRAAPSPRSPDWTAQVMVRRSPRFCKEGEAVHLRSPPARPAPPRVKAEPRRDPDDDDDDTVITGWPALDACAEVDPPPQRDDIEVDEAAPEAEEEKGGRPDAAGSDDCEIVGEAPPSWPRLLLPPGRRDYAAELSPAQRVPRTPDLRADFANDPPLPPPHSARPQEERAAEPSRGFDFLSLVPPPEDPLRSLFFGTERRLLLGRPPKRPRPVPRLEPGSGAAISCTTPSTITAATRYTAVRSCTTPSTMTAAGSCTIPTATSHYPTATNSTASSCSTITAASRCITPSTITTASRYLTNSYPAASICTTTATSICTTTAASSCTTTSDSSCTTIGSCTTTATSSCTTTATSSCTTPTTMTAASRYPAAALSRCPVPEAAHPGGATYVKTFIQRLTERDRQTGEVKVQQVARVSELDADLREQGRATTALYQSRELSAVVQEETPLPRKKTYSSD